MSSRMMVKVATILLMIGMEMRLLAASSTAMPSDIPSSMPSDIPSSMPSDIPSSLPSDMPSSAPSMAPSSGLDLVNDLTAELCTDPTELGEVEEIPFFFDFMLDLDEGVLLNDVNDIIGQFEDIIQDAVDNFLCNPNGRRRLSRAVAYKPNSADFVSGTGCPNCVEVHGSSTIIVSSSTYKEESDDITDVYCALAKVVYNLIRGNAWEAIAGVEGAESIANGLDQQCGIDAVKGEAIEATYAVLETVAPSSAPTDAPSSIPSDMPSAVPSDAPSTVPSRVPSVAPTSMPSLNPSTFPSDAPSDLPSMTPSYVPSISPSSSLKNFPEESGIDVDNEADRSSAKPLDDEESGFAEGTVAGISIASGLFVVFSAVMLHARRQTPPQELPISHHPTTQNEKLQEISNTSTDDMDERDIEIVTSSNAGNSLSGGESVDSIYLDFEDENLDSAIREKPGVVYDVETLGSNLSETSSDQEQSMIHAEDNLLSFSGDEGMSPRGGSFNIIKEATSEEIGDDATSVNMANNEKNDEVNSAYGGSLFEGLETSNGGDTSITSSQGIIEGGVANNSSIFGGLQDEGDSALTNSPSDEEGSKTNTTDDDSILGSLEPADSETATADEGDLAEALFHTPPYLEKNTTVRDQLAYPLSTIEEEDGTTDSSTCAGPGRVEDVV